MRCKAKPSSARRIQVAEIRARVCAYYRIPVSVVEGRKRTGRVSRARQVAMYLALELTPHSMKNVGRMFDRDHSTVSNGYRNIHRLRAQHPDFAANIATLLRSLAARP